MQEKNMNPFYNLNKQTFLKYCSTTYNITNRFKSNAWNSNWPDQTNGPGFEIMYDAKDCVSNNTCGQGNAQIA